MHQHTLRHRYSKLIALVMSAYMIFALGCFISDDDDNDNDPSGPNNPNGPNIPDGPITTLTGRIEAPQTWRGRLEVTGNVTVRNGATITIEPGTLIELCASCSIDFGWNGNAATIKANGTAAEPITFRGQSQTRGFWSSVIFGDNVTSDSVLSHTRFEHGGAPGADAAVLLNGPVRLDHVSVTESGAAGLRAEAFREGSANLTVDKVATHPIVVTTEGAIANFPAETTFDRATLTAGEPTVLLTMPNLGVTTTLRDIGIPYQLNGTLQVRTDGTVFTLEAGVELVGRVDRLLDVGWNGSDVTFLVQGTVDKPVILRGPVAEPGAWGGLVIGSDVTTDSKLTHLIVRDAGGGADVNKGEAVRVNAAITFEDLTIENAKDRGLVVGASGLRAGSKNLTVRDTQGYPVVLTSSTLTAHFEGDFSFEGNTNERILSEGTLMIERTGTIVNPGIPYEIGTHLSTRVESVVTIEPGTIFEFRNSTHAEFGWNGARSTIIAQGTASAPIIFRGLNATPGFWNGITVGPNVVTGSSFEHVHVLHGGGEEGNANLRLRAGVPVTSSRFANGSGFGVRIEREVGASYMFSDTNTFESNDKGEVDDKR